jgi:hypothetical protein
MGKNLGSKNNIQDWNNKNSYFSRGHDIDHIYRVSPRIKYSMTNLNFGLEAEYTGARYGNTRNSLGVIQTKSEDYPNAQVNDVGNYRFIFMMAYIF